MTLTRWKPFGDLFSLHNRINRLFEDELHREELPRSGAAFDSWYPATDVYETKDEYVFKLEVPGLSKDDVSVEFHEGTLSIKGEKKEETEINKENFHRIESFSGTFSRQFAMPKNADPNKISASMKEGILELRISKMEEKKAKAISINVK